VNTDRVDRRMLPAGRRCSRRAALQAGAAGLAASTLVAAGLRPTRAQDATPAASPTDHGDFAGLVDIGGRKLYLECHGEGSPTVVLVAGGGSSARYWTDDLLQPDAPRQMVMPAVAEFAHVFAYDRPGTYAFIGEEIFPPRSDAIPQPRTTEDMVDELHALLQAADVPGPYILAGHSQGGFVSRLYAATYPDEVIGLVLIDAYSELIEDLMPPEKWQALVRLNQELGGGPVPEIPGYGDAETTRYGASNAVVRAAVAASPLPPMPLAVLAHGKPFPQAADATGFAPGELEEFLLAANEAQARLVPDGRFWLATESGHDIHQDQPELVIEAIRQVVAGVLNPDTWYDLNFCCTS
jgi:pimeloyl-ACP methyl ester carboxylesterase